VLSQVGTGFRRQPIAVAALCIVRKCLPHY
jgi:hypothetical protein